MASNAQGRSLPHLPHDHAGMAKLKPREKAALMRQRLLDVGVDAECRRLSGTGEHLPPLSDFEMLFRSHASFIHLWDDFLLRVFPRHEVQLGKMNLAVVKARRNEAEAKSEKQAKRDTLDRLTEQLAKLNKERDAKEQLILSKESLASSIADKARRHRASRRASAVSSTLRRSKQLASSMFIDNELKHRERKLGPLEDQLQSYERIIANATRRGNEQEENEARENCRRELRNAVDTLKANTLRRMDNLNETGFRDTDGSTVNNNNNNDEDELPQEATLRLLLESYSRQTIVDAFVAETLEGVRSMREEAIKAQHLDANDASTLDCSIDESGVIVDEMARREEKELEGRKKAAKKDLQLKILQIEDEAASYEAQTDKLRAVSEASATMDPNLHAHIRRILERRLSEETASLQSLVDEASGQEKALQAKREKVQAAKDEMELTDNLIAAFSQQATCYREALKDAGNDDVTFDPSLMKEAAKEIRLKAASLQDSGVHATRTWSSLRTDQLAAHGHDSKDGNPALIRDVDAAPGISHSTRRSLADWIGDDASRRSFSAIMDAVLQKKRECDRKEMALTNRPSLKSIAELEEAAETWTVTRGAQVTPKTDDQQDGAANQPSSNPRPAKTQAALLTKADSVMNQIMERCVQLTAAEKTLSEEGAFSVNIESLRHPCA